MPKSILEAIKLGLWEFEPPEVSSNEYNATGCMPGTKEKLDVLAERIANGQPLWHPSDREDVEDPEPGELTPKFQRPIVREEPSIERKQAIAGHNPRKPR